MRAVLLSDERVQKALSERYVLCWQSVRDVPKVTIDFGGGKVLERTLKGNTAFYLCRADGRVVDVFPGVYTPEDFLAELGHSETALGMSDDQLLEWHRQQAPAPQLAEETRPITASKMAVESPILKAMAVPEHRSARAGDSDFARYAATLQDLSNAPRSRREVAARTPAGEGTPGDRLIADDSSRNRRWVRPGVHLLLSEGVKTPAECRAPIFKELLGVDLDDPYLGLGEPVLPGTP